MQTCAEHMWLASVTAVVGSTQETLGVRLAVNDRGGSQQTGSFHQSHFDKKNMKIFSLQYLISVGKKESYYIHVLFNFSIHWQLGLNGQHYTLFIYLSMEICTPIHLNASYHLWILWDDKQKYTAAVVLSTVFPLALSIDMRGLKDSFRFHHPNRCTYSWRRPLALAMPFTTLLLLRSGAFLKELNLWEDSCPSEKLFRLHFRFHHEGKN